MIFKKLYLYKIIIALFLLIIFIACSCQRESSMQSNNHSNSNSNILVDLKKSIKEFFTNKFTFLKTIKENDSSTEAEENTSAENSTLETKKDYKSCNTTNNDTSGNDILDKTANKNDHLDYNKYDYNQDYKQDYNTNSQTDYISKNSNNLPNSLAVKRTYFKKGIEAFENKEYILAEYCFSKIKSTYNILQDHVLYYLAKSQLMQKKYDSSEKNYIELKNNYPQSVFIQKAYLEHADLYFLTSDYANAEINYQIFLNKFTSSELTPYARYQLALCQEKNSKFLTAFENYKKIFLESPENEYSKLAYQAIQILIDKKIIDKFTLTNEQIYMRAEKFFKLYWYESAIKELNLILDNIKNTASAADKNTTKTIDSMETTNTSMYIINTDKTIESKALFKLGMCYFNLRDYKNAVKYLKLYLDKFQQDLLADDSIYFLARANYSLDNESEAINLYQKLIKQYPTSNYSDDALYRLGRIYFFKEQLEKASKYYKEIIEKYPNGDKIADAFWELGWIQYKSNNLNEAVRTFSDMEVKFSNLKSSSQSSSQSTIQLIEKALFWQAKSQYKLENNDEAIRLLKKIVDLNSYSYYTFASQNELKKFGIEYSPKLIDIKVNPFNYISNNKIDLNNNPDSDVNNLNSNDLSSSNSNNNSNNIILNKTVLNNNLDDKKGNNLYNNNLYNNSIKNLETLLPEIFKNSEDFEDADQKDYSHFEKAKELLELKLFSSTSLELDLAKPQFEKDNYSILNIATLYLLANDYINSQKIVAKYYSKLKSSLKSPYIDYFYYLIYPYGFKEYVDKYSKEFDLDPLYVLAIIREESRFDPKAGSYAGALGLMQIMPATAKSIANDLNLKNFNNNMLFEPETSIKMGCYYLKKQLENFNNNKFFAAGAYNGGPGAMGRWIKSYGSYEINEFIENVTYEETRNYIKKVMASYYFYQMIYK